MFQPESYRRQSGSAVDPVIGADVENVVQDDVFLQIGKLDDRLVYTCVKGTYAERKLQKV